MEVYNPTQGKWAYGKSMSVARGFLKVLQLDNKIYTAGGRVGEGANIKTSNIVEAYDAGANKWAPISSMHHARRGFGFVAWKGALYAIGGNDDDNPTMEMYDPREGVWKLQQWPGNLHKNTSFMNCVVAP